ncbi:MAG: hypothetical protein J7507_05235 [Pseudoxanthomonas sp.]|nr:hypothetical protein [Pseudoxanthomonas sp.]
MSLSPKIPNERRTPTPPPSPAQLEAGLTHAQLATVRTLQEFQWRLRFVRRPLFQAPVPVLFDRGEKRYVVIGEDGSIDENPSLKLRG